MVSETNFNLFDQNLNTEQKIETFSTTRDRTKKHEKLFSV